MYLVFNKLTSLIFTTSNYIIYIFYTIVFILYCGFLSSIHRNKIDLSATTKFNYDNLLIINFCHS